MNRHVPLAFLNRKNVSKLMAKVGSFDIDEDEQRLLDINAHPLIAIENASELVKGGILHTRGFIEKVLQFISKSSTLTNPNYSKLSSVVYVPSFEVPQDSIRDMDKLSHIKHVKKQIRALKSKHDHIITIISITFEEGAHYASYHYDATLGKFFFFDSMQQHKFGSSFSSQFKKIGEVVFDTDSKSGHFSKCISTKKLSYQFTGGFITPGSHINLLQTVDSQHHFCYMEALLHLAEKFTQYEFVPTYERTKMIRLVAIKRWIWCLIHLFASDTLTKDPLFYKYLKTNFMVIWHNHHLKFTDKSEWYLNLKSKNAHINYRVYKISHTDIQNIRNDVSMRDLLNYVHNTDQIILDE